MSNKFSDFNIQKPTIGYVGDKIKIEKILDKEFKVLKYKIIPSNKRENTLCLCMQIIYKEEKRVIFTGYTSLMDMIGAVPKDKFPFDTIIIKEDERYIFT